ncbi:MAG: tetratricopeptide repeat protein [Planctomycetes bacterium]|nr:tetratricopeptide repeat protein [Planctomycetota bacterium]
MPQMPNRLAPIACVLLAACCLARAEEPPAPPTPAAAPAAAPDPAALRAELDKITGKTFKVFGDELKLIFVLSDANPELAKYATFHLHQVLPRMRAMAGFPPDATVPEAVVVALFQEPADCAKFLKARGAGNEPSFAYLHDDDPARRVIAAFALDPRPMVRRLRHSAFNALLRAWIARPPAWLSRGLAEVMEDASLDEETGRLELGPARGHVRDLRERLLNADPPRLLPLREFLSGDAPWKKDPLSAAVQAWSFARFLIEDARMEEARTLSSMLRALAPNASEDENRANVLKQVLDEEWKPLETAWKEYITHLPETPGEAPYRQARALINKMQFDAARPLLDEAIKLDPAYDRLYYYRGLCSFHLKRHGLAVTDLGYALTLFPEYHAARFLRGRARAALNDRDGARADFEACKATPYAAKAEKELAALEAAPTPPPTPPPPAPEQKPIPDAPPPAPPSTDPPKKTEE